MASHVVHTHTAACRWLLTTVL